MEEGTQGVVYPKYVEILRMYVKKDERSELQIRRSAKGEIAKERVDGETFLGSVEVVN